MPTVRVVWTQHAEQRLDRWQSQLGLTREEIEDIVASPEQTVPGDLGAWIAQTRHADGLVRIIFVEELDERRIVTLYWTSRVGRYWLEA